MTNDEIKSMIESRDYDEVKDQVRGMDQHELQSLYYWGFKLRKFIFCSAASMWLHDHFGVTPAYELCSERMSEYT